jgi:hypothetical protein
MNNDLNLEQLWNDLLSRENRLILKAFTILDKESQQAVLQHLSRMSEEPGWHPEQRISAKAALRVLDSVK